MGYDSDMVDLNKHDDNNDPSPIGEPALNPGRWGKLLKITKNPA